MACKDQYDECNKLVMAPKDDMPLIVLKFGYYVNWGRPNHNPSRLDPIINLLGSKGYGVQLEHDADVPDYVEFLLKSDNSVLCKDDTFQHNANYHKRDDLTSDLIEKMEIKLKA